LIIAVQVIPRIGSRRRSGQGRKGEEVELVEGTEKHVIDEVTLATLSIHATVSGEMGIDQKIESFCTQAKSIDSHHT
jgi:hypothetical protein